MEGGVIMSLSAAQHNMAFYVARPSINPVCVSHNAISCETYNNRQQQQTRVYSVSYSTLTMFFFFCSSHTTTLRQLMAIISLLASQLVSLPSNRGQNKS